MRGPIQTGRHAVGWNPFAKWSESCSAVRAGFITKERRGEMERASRKGSAAVTVR